MRVDVHAHHYPATCLERLARCGLDTSRAVGPPGAAITLEERIDLLGGAGIRVQVLSAGAMQPYVADPERGAAAARLANDLYAEVWQKHAGRFDVRGPASLTHELPVFLSPVESDMQL